MRDRRSNFARAVARLLVILTGSLLVFNFDMIHDYGMVGSQIVMTYPRQAALGEFLFQWGSGGTGDGRFSNPRGIAINESGYVYVVDANNNSVQIFTPTGQFLFRWGSTGAGDGQFNQPLYIAINQSGAVYITDSCNDRVQVFNCTGQFLFKWGSSGHNDGEFYNLEAIAINASGQVYVADSSNNRVQVFDMDGHFLFKWGSDWVTPGTGDGEFSIPYGIAINSTGCIYVAEWGNNRVQVFTPEGQFIRKWGSTGSGNSQFENPCAIAINPEGQVFVGDDNNHRVQVFRATGQFLFTWGWASLAPFGVTINSTGRVYVADTANLCVRVFAMTLGVMSTGLTSGQVFGAESPTFSLVISGLNPVDEVWYSFDGGSTNTTCGFTGTLAVQWGNYEDGPITVIFWANDTTGYTCDMSILLRKDTLTPLIISYVLYLTIAICSGIAIVQVVSITRKKHRTLPAKLEVESLLSQAEKPLQSRDYSSALLILEKATTIASQNQLGALMKKSDRSLHITRLRKELVESSTKYERVLLAEVAESHKLPLEEVESVAQELIASRDIQGEYFRSTHTIRFCDTSHEISKTKASK